MNSLNNWETDKNSDLLVENVVTEAIYILSTFSEEGHTNYDKKNGEGADSSKRVAERKEWAQKEMRSIRAFIRKYKKLAKN